MSNSQEDKLGPITAERIKERIQSQFPSVYLTLLSIIQGVALGLFAAKIWENYTLIFERCDFMTIWATLITFLLLIHVWHEYVIASISMLWIPKLLDALLPFGLGLGEFILIQALAPLSVSRWFWGAVILSSFGICAYFNTAFRMEKRSTSSEKAKNLIIREARVGAGMSLITLVICLLKLTIFPQTPEWVFLLILTALFGALFMLKGYWFWKKQLREWGLE